MAVISRKTADEMTDAGIEIPAGTLIEAKGKKSRRKKARKAVRRAGKAGAKALRRVGNVFAKGFGF